MISSSIIKNEKIRNKFRFLFVLFIIINSILIRESYGINSSIFLQIKGTGTQKIFSNETDCSFKGMELIDKIYVNDSIENKIDYYVYGLRNQLNNITIIFKENFNEQLTDFSCMFRGCESIISVDLSNLNSTNVKKTHNMFYNCTSLLSIDFGNFDTSEVTDMGAMFQLCTSLLSLDVSKFNTSKVELMWAMFNSLKSLKSLDLSNFNTQNVLHFVGMFAYSTSLISIDLSSFKTSNIYEMNNMFEGCSSLISLNLSQFDTTKVTECKQMLGSTNLVYCIDNDKNYTFRSLIDENKINCSDICFTNKEHKLFKEKNKCLNNCYDLKLYEYNGICYNNSCPNGTKSKNNSYICEIYNKEDNENNKINESNLTDITSINSINISDYIDLYNISDSNLINISGYYDLYNISDSINLINISDYIDLNDLSNLSNISDNNSNDFTGNFNLENEIKICPFNNKNIIKEKNICIKNCYDDAEYPYEYNNICYKLCPNNSYIKENNNYLCIKECPVESPYENENNECVNYCNARDLLTKKCWIKNYSSNLKDNLIENIRNELLTSNLDELLKNINKGEDLFIEDNNCIYQITSIYNQNNNDYDDISTIKLKECEKTLRDYYKLNSNDTLLIFKIDYYEEGLLIPIIEYEIYNLNKTKLNLSICNKTKINVFLPANINESEAYKHNSSNEYYNDICFTYTTGKNTDITLNDRKNEFIKNNMSLCESNCTFKGYNNKTKKAECECSIKISFPLISEIQLDKDKLLNKFMDVKNILNLNVMKCYKLLFQKKGIIKNIGNYLILSIILITIINCIIFAFKGYKSFKKKIEKILDKKDAEMNKINKNTNSDKAKKGKNKIIKEKKLDFKNKLIVNNNKRNSILTIKNNKILKNKNVNKNRIKKVNNNFINKEGSKRSLKNTDISKKYKLKDINNIIPTSNKNKRSDSKTQYNDYELNNLLYEEALKIDKRKFTDYYFSLLRMKHPLIFTFYTKTDYNSRYIKICLFFFSFSLNLTVNALFFNDKTMHKIYLDEGKFNFVYQIPQILYSMIISTAINIIISFLSLSEKKIIEMKHRKIYNKKKLNINLKIHFILFFILAYILLIFFWFYLSCFCIVFPNTQIHLIKDTLISLALSFTYNIFTSLLPCFFRIYSLKIRKQCLYKISQLLQLI